MTSSTTVTHRRQLLRMRRLAQRALVIYGLEGASLAPIGHLYNTTFKVSDGNGSRYVLRIQRPDTAVDTRSRVDSELWWMERLRADLRIAVPEPVRASNGETVVQTSDNGREDARLCVLFRWMDGRFLHRGLTPEHLQEVGRLTARLHNHSAHLTVPPGFNRPLVADASPAAEEERVRFFTDTYSAEAARLVRGTVRRLRRAQEELNAEPPSFGLIHADIHQENYLFGAGTVRLIDFDDCGWGHFLYDLAVTIHNTDELPQAAELRAGLLSGYRQVRDLSSRQEGLIEPFFVFRELQMTTWHLEERNNPAFATWERHVAYGLSVLERAARED